MCFLFREGRPPISISRSVAAFRQLRRWLIFRRVSDFIDVQFRKIFCKILRIVLVARIDAATRNIAAWGRVSHGRWLALQLRTCSHVVPTRHVSAIQHAARSNETDRLRWKEIPSRSRTLDRASLFKRRFNVSGNSRAENTRPRSLEGEISTIPPRASPIDEKAILFFAKDEWRRANICKGNTHARVSMKNLIATCI